MNFEFREVEKLTPAGYEALNAVEAASFDEDEGFSPEDMPELFERSNYRLLIYNDDKICGYVLGRHAFGVAYFYSVAILPDYRRFGLASKAFQKMKVAFQAKGCLRICSHCDIHNEASAAMHRHFGFSVVSYEPDFYGDNKDAVSWSLTL